MTAVRPNATPSSAFAQVAPLERKPRPFIICFDDTTYNPTYYKTPSNVSKMMVLLRGNNDDLQMVCSHVGTIFCSQCQFLMRL